jgi:fumarate hydratase class I
MLTCPAAKATMPVRRNGAKISLHYQGAAMEAKILQANLLELIRRTSAELPDDVKRGVRKGLRKEKKNSTGQYALQVINDNIIMAKDKSQPLCQDTGVII